MVRYQLKPLFQIVRFIFGVFVLFSCTASQPPTMISETEPRVVQKIRSQQALLKTILPKTADVAYPITLNPLASFYRSLDRFPGRYTQVNILHLGDSHTAGDQFSGRLRQLFQARFGSAGRGMLPVGKPFPYFRPSNVSLWQSQGWQVSNSRKTSTKGPYGLSGFRIQSADPKQAIRLKMTDGTRFDEIDIEFQRHPKGGTMVVEVDKWPFFEIRTESSRDYVDRHRLTIPGGGSRVKISPKGDGPIKLLSWTFRRNQFGIIYHSHGIVSATINVINQWSRNVVSWEMVWLEPSLIIVAYGTNEGFHDDLNWDEYKQDFQARLALLHRSAPQASIVVVGPPDANRLPRYCQKRQEVDCEPLTPYEIEHYIALRQEKNEQLCRWHPPPKLNVVREIQREVAAEAGYFFWDWSTVMGGACGTHTWSQEKPRLAGKDHVHFSQRGYKLTADALFKALMADYSG
ncbi:MAG TPA: hypothetical protein EYP59_04510 [Thiotrichaceae bacterium]|nr:hypothetical protein [Thiotrichaceae bacterium]